MARMRLIGCRMTMFCFRISELGEEHGIETKMKVLVNSLPKSGTHLLGTFLERLGFIESVPGLTGAQVRETNRNPFRNWQKRQRRPKQNEIGFWIDLDIKGNAVSKEWLHGRLSSIPDGCFISSHLPYSTELADFIHLHDFKILNIHRDPRDVIISFINYEKSNKELPFHEDFKRMSMDAALEQVLRGAKRGNFASAPLRDRIERMMGWLGDQRVYSTTFESLVGPKGGGCKSRQRDAAMGICRHIGFSVIHSRLDEVVETIFDPRSQTFSKGMVGQWKEIIGPAQLDKVMANMGDFISTLGYD